MKKLLPLIIAISIFVFAGCVQKACTMEAKICPDGSSVGRTGPNCEFEACPACNYEDTNFDYKGRTLDVCSRIKFSCGTSEEYFSNECGCGCKKLVGENGEHYCSDYDRKKEVCPQEEHPVCGWANEKIQCFAYPCASTYQNSCFACVNENVAHWTEGVCPKVGS